MNQYEVKFIRGDEPLEVVMKAWELMKFSCEPETKMLCKILFDAFAEYDGNADSIKHIFNAWWGLFQKYFEGDNSEKYWQAFYDDMKEFQKEYGNAKTGKMITKLATGALDFQQWRLSNG